MAIGTSRWERVLIDRIAWAAVLALAALVPVAAQSVREAQLRSAQATDERVLNTVAQFRAAVLEKWGGQARFGGLEIGESEVKANVHVGGKVHGTRFLAGSLKQGDQYLLTEASEAKADPFALDVLDEAFLRRFLKAAHSGPDGDVAHVVNIQMARFPAPLPPSVLAVQLIGNKGLMLTAFDLETGRPFDLQAEMAKVRGKASQ